ncbi:MAG: diphthine--ammonia ligase [Candidatus Micrarchaeia archaeon]
MKVACLFSGGKDSCYAAFWSIYSGFDVILICVKSEEDSYMFHHPNLDKTKLQAKEMELEIEYIDANNKNELLKLEEKLKELKVEGIVTGAFSSEYQKQRIDIIGERLGIPAFSPLWHKEDEIIEEIKKYFKTYIVSVSAEGLFEKHLGMNFKDIGEIKGVNKMFEGGEAETFVSYAPFFKNEISIKCFRKKWDGIRGVAEIEV